MVRDLNAALTDGSWAGSTRVRAWPMWAIWSGVTPRPAYEVPGRRRSGHREWWSSDQFFDARLPDGLDVVLVLEDHSESAVDQLGGERPGIEETERLGPVQRLGDTGWLEQVHRTQTRHGRGQRARQRLVDARDLAADDGGGWSGLAGRRRRSCRSRGWSPGNRTAARGGRPRTPHRPDPARRSGARRVAHCDSPRSPAGVGVRRESPGS